MMSVLNGWAEALVSDVGFTGPIASRYSVRALPVEQPKSCLLRNIRPWPVSPRTLHSIKVTVPSLGFTGQHTRELPSDIGANSKLKDHSWISPVSPRLFLMGSRCMDAHVHEPGHDSLWPQSFRWMLASASRDRLIIQSVGRVSCVRQVDPTRLR